MTSTDSITTLPPISTFPTLPETTQTAILDLLFEPSAALHTLAAPTLSTEHASYDALISRIGDAMHALTASPDAAQLATLDGILCAHPRLGEKKVESRMSRMEQAAMNNNNNTQEETEEQRKAKEDEAEMLRALNSEYEEVFSGLIYTVFVNGRARPVIMRDMRERIARGDREAERRDAIDAMCAIAADRAKKLQ